MFQPLVLLILRVLSMLSTPNYSQYTRSISGSVSSVKRILPGTSISGFNTRSIKYLLGSSISTVNTGLQDSKVRNTHTLNIPVDKREESEVLVEVVRVPVSVPLVLSQ